jgi:hypothetical protein
MDNSEEFIQNFKFRGFFQKSQFKNVFNFDETLQKKIQIIYRVSYLKDSIFGKDDPSSMRSATILYNNYSA